ncbi:MAG: VCBS repeat-containing protein, partial [Candidatus Omnitrophica bacterium]|nr:VCBS repeat-containing protein [Candidatus Omnitrophota bacterium]
MLDRQSQRSLRTGWTAFLVLLFLSPALAVDKSGVKPTSISLPSGPGSIEGLGSDFEPHLNTGTSSYNVPISLPAGTAGHSPSLSLNYEGGFGNSSMGIAWSFSNSSIRRQCEKGIPRYEPNGADDDFDGLTDETDEQDRFLDPSGEELVLMDNGIYYPENQEQFIRWRHITTDGNDYWEGHLPSGVIQEYGLTEESRVHEGERIYKWCLQRIVDTNGNVIEYDYVRFPGSDNQIYCSAIRYGPGAPPWDAFYMVTMTYEDRPDVLDDYRSGFLMRTGKRLKQIDIALQGDLPTGHLIGDINSDGINDALIRRYVLDYETHPHWSLLSKVTIFGADGVSSLPPAEFEYGVRDQPRVVSAANAVIGTKSEPLKVMDNDFVDLIDINADALPDILRTELGGQHLAYLNQGVRTEGGRDYIQWGPPQNVDSSDNGDLALVRNLNEAEVSLTDVDGDGLADLVLNSSINPRYFKNNGDVSWGSTKIIEIKDGEDFPPAPYSDPAAQTVDLNFDKNIDIIRPISGGYQVWYSLGPRRSDSPNTHRYSPKILTPGASHDGAVLRFADELGNAIPGMTLADLNGDRVTDVARIRPTSVVFAPSMGYGNYADSIVMQIPPDNGFGHDEGFAALTQNGLLNAELIDITGNGLADLVVRGEGFRELWYWINLGNCTFDQRRIVTQLPTAFSNPNPEIRWADLNGNGTDDLVYSDSELEPGQKLRTIDLGLLINGDPCPFLMNAIDNGIGGRTEIEYLPTTKYAISDLLSGNPWSMGLPHVSIVVNRITQKDGLGRSFETEFEYHDGYYDGVEKEFRGFSRSERQEIGDDSQPTLITEFHFDVGNRNEALKGKTLRTLYKTESGEVFSESEDFWNVRNLFAARPSPDDLLAPNGVDFPFVERSVGILHEEPSGATQPIRLEREYSYDDYGNRVMAADYGQVQDDDRNFGNDERVHWFVYNATPESSIWNLEVETFTTDNSQPARLVTHNRIYYDGPSFIGLDLGKTTRGNLVRSTKWVGPPNSQNPPDPLPHPEPRFLIPDFHPDNTISVSIQNASRSSISDNQDLWIDTDRYQVDDYGNVTAQADPLSEVDAAGMNLSVGHFREFAYDPLLHAYAIAERIHTGRTTLEMEAGFDLAFGRILEATDFNGNKTEIELDSFGRTTKIVRPGGSPADSFEMPTVSYEYQINEPVPIAGGTGFVNWVETRAHEQYGDPDAYHVSRSYTDGFGRVVLEKEEGESPDRVISKVAPVFNSRGKIKESLLPFFSEKGMGFEDIRAPDWTGICLIDGEETERSLKNSPRKRMLYDATGRC